MSHHPTPLKFLMPGWFAVVMGLAGLSLAWHRAAPVLGDLAGGISLAIAALAALVFSLLAAASLLRRQRYPDAVAEDLRHPVRHAFWAAIPISLILLVTCWVALAGPGEAARWLWRAASAVQFGVTVWVLGRWLAPKGAPVAFNWAAFTPALFIPVVGNVLVPLAGVPLGESGWSAAQFGVGLFFWPVVTVLLLVRIGMQGLWPDRLLPATFITVAPPAVIGLSVLQLGAPIVIGWVAWGLALFFVLWSLAVVRRMLAHPFAVPFWGLSFPLAAFAALTLRLAPGVPAVLVLAVASLVIAALVLATLKGLREGTLLAPEPVAPIVPAQA